MENKEGDRSKRGIESIAHLFLSQLGNEINECEAKKPAVPQESADNITDSNIHNNIPADKTADDTVMPGSLENSLAGEIVLAYHLRDPFSKVCQYARYQSQLDGKVALFSIDQYEVTMSSGFDDMLVENAEVIAETEVNGAELIPVINREAGDYDLILLNVDPSFSGRVKEIISYADCVTIISDCSNEGIINSYKVLKSVCSDILDDQEIQLFICDAPNEEYADKAFYKFNDTARKYIDKVIVPAGCTIVDDFPAKPMDDSGITEQEYLELNEVFGEAELPEEEDRICAEEVSEADELIDIEEEYVGEETDFEYYEDLPEPVIIETVQHYDLSNYQVASSDTENDDCSDEPECHETGVEESEVLGRGIYKPLCSQAEEVSEPEAKPERKQLVINNESSSGRFRANVVSRPEMVCPYTGPSTLKPVELHCKLDNDFSVCNFVSMNFGRLTGCYGAVPVEHRPFGDKFPNSYIMIQPSGVPTIFISVIYEVGAVELIEDICSWFSENIGVLASRYRNLKIKSDVSPELVVIAGKNYDDIYDEAMLVADEYNSICKVWHLVKMDISGKSFVSLY